MGFPSARVPTTEEQKRFVGEYTYTAGHHLVSLPLLWPLPLFDQTSGFQSVVCEPVGSGFNTVNNFDASLGTFLSDELRKHDSKECTECQYTFMALPWFVLWHQQYYPALLLHHHWKCQHSEKSQIMS